MKPILALLPAIAGITVAATPAEAARCRGSNGRFIKCPPPPVLCPDGTTVAAGQTCPSPTPSPTPVPTPTPTPSPSTGDVLSPNGVKGEFDIADNFDITPWLIASEEVPGTEPDPIGAFRFTCLGGHLSHDDPIVYPGQPGKSHLHQFFGNTLTDANSTYNSLRTTGGSTCTRSTSVSVQRSAYWMPAVLDGAGNAVKADWMNTYYKAMPANNSGCGAPDATHIGYCIPIPNGIRFIQGYNMANGLGGPASTDTSASSDYWKMGFDCVVTDGTGASYTGVKHTIADIVATGKCPVGAWLRVFVTFPDCWDGVHLDTADHRSHMAYASGALIQNFKLACPADHPYNIPEIALQAFFRTDANFANGKWHLSSDEMVAGVLPGTTLHADYWEAWSNTVKNIWQTNCINGHLSCSAGDLGNGQEAKGMQQVGSFPNHVLVPLSSIP